MRRRHLALLAAAGVLLLILGDWAKGSVADAGDTQVPLRRAPKVNSTLFARIELGRRLFFDPAASQSGARSCASCHDPDHGWSDPGRVSADDVGDTLRHSQTIVDAAFNPTAHWDGEFSSVEHLVAMRLGSEPRPTGGGGYGSGPFTPRGPRGRGPTTRQPTKRPQPVTPGERRPLLSEFPMPARVSPTVTTRLGTSGRYKEAFAAAFKTKSVSLTNIARAIAAFVHSIESTTAPFDRYRAGDLTALSASAQRGLALFEGRAGCNQCHLSEGEHPLFTDYAFHNTGVSKDEVTNMPTDGPSRDALIQRILRNHVQKPDQLKRALAAFADGGRTKATGQKADLRKFKTPTLRDVAARGPYMHSGRFKTLHEVVRYYAEGGGPDNLKSKHLNTFACSEQDTDDLVAFLESLSGATRPGRATKAWTKRRRQTRLSFVDAADRPLKGLEVRLVPSGDRIPVLRAPAEAIQVEVTNRSGILHFEPAATTHTRIVLPEGLEVLGGRLVPDTCAKAKIRVPVAGRMTFIVTFADGASAPPLLVGLHPEREVVLGHPPQRTTFVRVGEAIELKGAVVAKYEGWARTDVGHTLTLQIPGRETHDDGERIRADLRYPIMAGAEIRLDLRKE